MKYNVHKPKTFIVNFITKQKSHMFSLF